MADKRIIELDTKEAVAVDDYVALDGQTGGTKKFLASQLGGKAEVMTEAEWEDLPDDKYTDNKVYVLTDAEPPESQLFAKVGSASLDTSADNLSDAINEHESDITSLNSKMVKEISGTLPTTDSSFDITYPSGKTKNNMNIIGFGFYRNATWFFNMNAVSVALTNTNINVTIMNDFSYIKGLPYKITYAPM